MSQGIGSLPLLRRFLGTSRTKLDTMTNQLKNELSPYLLQHQHNPVHWQPWNSETLELARTTGKPIFLSSGYSTCHWCHVMERESFENQSIADIMNEKFINIKLDREERPNIDGMYMYVVQAITGGGGWPMSVWMTPDLHPFYAGTYFPPEDRYYGRPGFRAILLTIAEHWEENQSRCIESGIKIVETLKKSANLSVGTTLPTESIQKCRNQLGRSYEPSFGGFSEQPKFPQPVNLQFLIHYSRKDRESFNMVDRTLTMMRKGGIFDHLGQGFSRYSTDKKWHVPHFEKMLYDQGQIVSAYLNAYLVSKNQKFASIAHEVLEYVSRDMSIEGGGFYSAEDADSLPTKTSTEKKEGAFYVWEKSEIHSILGNLKLSNGKGLDDLVCARFGVKENGNVDPFQDPHDELKMKNVFFLDKGTDVLATEFDIPETEVVSELEKAREKLFDWRNINRPRPHLDNKFIASWNGLITTAYAQAGFIFSNESYIERAQKSIAFIEENFYFNGDLLRTCYSNNNGQIVNLARPIPGCVEDFANVITALLEIFQATTKVHYLKLALQLQEKQNSLFWDDKSGGYFTGRADDASVIVRLKDDDDGAEPSSNSTSVINLMRLNSLFPGQFSSQVEKVFLQFSERLSKISITLPLMNVALMSHQEGFGRILVIGKEPQKSEFMTFLKKKLIPLGSIIICLDLNTDLSEIEKLIPSITEKIRKPGDEVVVFIQKGNTEMKIETVESLATVFD